MTPSVRLSSLFQQTASFIMKHLPVLLFATGLPVLVSYAVVWLTVGATFTQIKNTNSFEDLTALFSFSSPLTYTIILTGVVVLAINILGWVAGPLITIQPEQARVRSIFQMAVKFFWSYFALALIVIFATIVLELSIFLMITIIMTLVGFVNQDAIFNVETYLITILPDLGLLLLAMSVMFAPYFLIEEKIGAWQAILKSANLVKHHFVTTLIRFLLIAVMIIICSFVLSFIPIVGSSLAYLVGSITLTVYNYFLYKGLLAVER